MLVFKLELKLGLNYLVLKLGLKLLELKLELKLQGQDIGPSCREVLYLLGMLCVGSHPPATTYSIAAPAAIAATATITPAVAATMCTSCCSCQRYYKKNCQQNCQYLFHSRFQHLFTLPFNLIHILCDTAMIHILGIHFLNCYFFKTFPIGRCTVKILFN